MERYIELKQKYNDSNDQSKFYEEARDICSSNENFESLSEPTSPLFRAIKKNPTETIKKMI